MKQELTKKQVKSIIISISFEIIHRKKDLKECENLGNYIDKNEEITYLNNRIKELEELQNFILG